MRRVWFFVLFLTLCLLMSALCLRPSLAEDTGINAAPYLQELARIRGVPMPAQPKIVVRSEEETRQLLTAGLDLGLPRDWWDSQEKTLRKFALIPSNFRLKEAVLDLLSEMILAYFDFGRQELVMRRPPASAEDLTTFLHELVHLIQSSLIDTKAFITLGPGRGDEALARRAVLEGEAQGLMLDFLLARQGKDITKLPDLAVLTRMSLPPLPERTQTLPRFLREEILFPYVYGLEFVRQFRLRYPWAQFSRVYRDPPRSTAQILSPQKYFLFRKDPSPVRLPDVSQALGDGWRLIKEDDLGALGMIFVLQVFLDEAEARRLTEDWEGDRYQLYEDRAGRLALIVFSTWRLPWKADEFALEYQELLKKKYPGLTSTSSPGGLVRLFRVGDEALAVERQNRHVLVIEGVSPDREAVVREAVWRARPAP